jgi:hypothetical protein
MGEGEEHMNKNEQVKGMANPNRGSVGVQEAQPPQRKPLTDEQRKAIVKKWCAGDGVVSEMIDLIEAAHGIKGNT